MKIINCSIATVLLMFFPVVGHSGSTPILTGTKIKTAEGILNSYTVVPKGTNELNADIRSLKALYEFVAQIKDNSEKNRYEFILKGKFIVDAKDFSDVQYRHSLSLLPCLEYCRIRGEAMDKTYIICKLPADGLEGEYNYCDYNIIVLKDSMIFSDMTLVMKNARYPVHGYGGELANKSVLLERMKIIYEGSSKAAFNFFSYISRIRGRNEQ